MPKYMNITWVRAMMTEIQLDNGLRVELDHGMLCSELLIDSLQKCYPDVPVMDN